MFRSVSEIALYFILYSMLGWVCETVFCSLRERHFVNRGFLKGPYCPIYGFGAVVILLVSLPVQQWQPVVFVVAMVSATLLEYFASWLLEALFQIRWWDYSENRFNVHGRVCLSFSITFGAMGLAMTYLIHPPLHGLVSRIPAHYLLPITNLLGALFFVDLIATLNNLLRLTQRLKTLQTQLMELRRISQQEDWFDAHDVGGSLKRLRRICQQDADTPQSASLLELLDSIERSRQTQHRLLRAFPRLRTREYGEALDAVRENFHRRSSELRLRGEKLHTRIGSLVRRAGQHSAGAGKAAAHSFVTQLDLYSLFWVFSIASLIGYLVETAFCLVTTGAVESRQGMLFGPFNQIYGFGAVLMVLLLTPLQKKSDRWLFVGGALLGGGFEALCSLLQEQLFGTISWQYDDHIFSFFGGRTSLTFMFFWGILGVWFMKGIYPVLLRLIHRFPKRQTRTITAVLAVFLCVNMLLSAAAVSRWAQRARGEEARGAVEQFLDKEFPDSFMRDVYPNMKLQPGEPESTENGQPTM